MPAPSQWEELYRRRPGKATDDPSEVELVRGFKENMGDFKLKSSVDYVVPRHQQTSGGGKRREILRLKDQVRGRDRI